MRRGIARQRIPSFPRLRFVSSQAAITKFFVRLSFCSSSSFLHNLSHSKASSVRRSRPSLQQLALTLQIFLSLYFKHSVPCIRMRLLSVKGRIRTHEMIPLNFLRTIRFLMHVQRRWKCIANGHMEC